VTVRSSKRARTGAGHADQGFTLIEVIFAIVLATMITGVVAAAIVTSLSVARATTDQVGDSTDAGLISAFLIRDAQSAGATDPTTAVRDSTLGVTTDASAAGWSDCAQPATFVVRFSWLDRTASASTRVVVYYLLDSTRAQLTRRVCRSGTLVDVQLASHLTSAVAACDTACNASPTSVSLTLVGTGTRSPFSYTMKASLRNDIQATPTVGNSPPVPLLALGAGASVACPNLTLLGTGAITVRGNVLIDGSCGTTPISGSTTVLLPTGATSAITGINNPFAGRIPPTFACGGGTNPTTIGVSATRDTLTVYPQKVSIASGATVFQPGRYVFCNGLEITGGQVTGTDVLLYVAGGTMLVNATATVDLTGRTAGVEANLLVWVDSPSQTIQINGGPRVSSLRGILYAPTSVLQLSSSNAANVGGIVVKSMTVAGAGAARIGLPLPLFSVTPATIPLGEVGVSHVSTTLVASGGTAPYTWSATGLPGGLSMTTSGSISGVPTVSGTFPIVVTVVDATAEAASADYSVTINPTLSVVWPSALPNGEVGVAYVPATPTASGGTTPYTWSATGLPAGLAINATTGAISGTPTAAGTFTVTDTVTDAMTASSTKTYTVTINPALSVVWLPTLPNGEVGVAYAPAAPTASGGTTPYTWSATGLPAGLAITATTGAISGTPTAAGSFTVTGTVTDAMTASSTKTYNFTIAPPLTVAWPSALPSGQVGTAYTPATPTASGGTTPYTWSATGLPAGLSINSSTGTISGTPTAAGTSTVVVKVTDAMTATSTQTYSVTVIAPIAGCPATIAGWQGEYFSNMTLSGKPVVCRDDESINFDWGSGSPDPAVPVDNFSARWTRTQTFAAGTYNFVLGSDDGGRLYIDNVLVIDHFVDQAYAQFSAQKTLSQGPHTMRVEYYERGGLAKATLAMTLLDNGVTATPSVSGDQTFFGQENITVSSTSTITAMNLTIKVAQTTGITFNGQYETYGNGLFVSTNSTAGGFITYAFNLKSNRSVAAGSGLLAAQFNGTGTPHPTSGDTWTLTTTTALDTVTQTGTF